MMLRRPVECTVGGSKPRRTSGRARSWKQSHRPRTLPWILERLLAGLWSAAGGRAAPQEGGDPARRTGRAGAVPTRIAGLAAREVWRNARAEGQIEDQRIHVLRSAREALGAVSSAGGIHAPPAGRGGSADALVGLIHRTIEALGAGDGRVAQQAATTLPRRRGGRRGRGRRRGRRRGRGRVLRSAAGGRAAP